jgi:anti-sigma regulatory factor (Ser/Thr protein kinase)
MDIQSSGMAADTVDVMHRDTSSPHRLRFTTGSGMAGRLARRLREVLVLDVRRPEARALALLAVEEVAANILEHGYGGTRGKPIEVLVRIREPEVFEVTIKDRARMIDISRIPPGNLKKLAKQQAERGRGLALVQILTREMNHQERLGGGNVTTLVFDAEHLSEIAREHSRGAA